MTGMVAVATQRSMYIPIYKAGSMQGRTFGGEYC